MYDLIVIGGGASGIICAIVARMRGKKVLIVDSNNFVGKKLLVTGNGKCNLTNINCDSTFYNQNIDQYLKKFDVKQTLKFFDELGLVTYYDEEGRVYPYSNSAKSVLEVLNRKLLELGVEMETNKNVCKVEKHETFCVYTDANVYKSRKVVFATGGKTIEFIKNNFKTKNKTNMPSLCALLTESTKKLSGIRLSDVSVTVKCDGKIKSEIGEVLFKDSGVSGIVVFNLSSMFARFGKFSGEISINLMPKISRDCIRKMLVERCQKYNTLCDAFVGWFQKEISNEIIRKSGMDDKHTTDLNKNEIERIVDSITNLTYKVVGNYDNNQVYSGGVLLSELTENLESKIHNGLYFCGEICDVDGVCGGYNLQWAWTSGYIVGESV